MNVPRILLVSALFGLVSACTNPAEKLPVYDHVPAFSAIDSYNRQFTSQQMDGTIWVVDFIYTNCPAECPRMSSQMRKVAAQFQDKRDVRFLSISVDPARDSPPVLRTFAARWGASKDQWLFVTGTPQTIHLLANVTFHVGDLISVIEHSTKFALVDRKRTIRGYYSSFDPESLAQLRQDVENLRRLKQ